MRWIRCLGSLYALERGLDSRPQQPALERDVNGQPIYGWKRNTDPLSSSMLNELVQNGHIDRADAPFRLRDVESGDDIYLHRASVYWNEYRDAGLLSGMKCLVTVFSAKCTMPKHRRPKDPGGVIKVATHDSPDGDYGLHNHKTHRFLTSKAADHLFRGHLFEQLRRRCGNAAI